MDYNHISKLLERYFEGETTLVEERELRRYFSVGPVAEAHRPYRDLFRFFAAGQETALASEIAPDRAVPPANIRRLRIRTAWWRAAAVIAIALGAWWLYPTTEPQPTAIDWSQYEPASVEEAFRLTSDALKSASAKLNYGAKEAAREVSKMKKVF